MEKKRKDIKNNSVFILLNIMKTKSLIRILIIVIIVAIMWFSDWTFATEESAFWDIAWVLDFIVSILSWIWILFAKLAWEFLTNKWVYWEVIWLDVLLWRYWNVMKNIANFWLWFYFVYVILKWLINQWKEDIVKNIKGILLWMLVAWIWIQASRFFTSVIIDVSTITLTAVWSFPSQVVSWNSDVKNSIQQSFCHYLEIVECNDSWIVKWKTIELFKENSKATEFLSVMTGSLDKSITWESLFDKLMPNSYDLSWPLYYMWFVILDSNKVPSVKSFDLNWLKETVLNLIVLWWTTIIYSIEMAILCVLALMRIIYLWMFIVLSPLAVLLLCIKASWGKLWWWGWGWFIGKLMNQINLKSFLINVFKPTIIVLFIWLTVILTSLIKDIINKHWVNYSNPDPIWWVKITHAVDQDSNTSSYWDKTYTTTIEWAWLKYTFSHLWKWLLDLLLSIITVVLVYMIIKVAVKMWWWKDFVSEKINKMQDNIENTMKNIPFVPVAWYDEKWIPTTSYLNFNDAKDFASRKITAMQDVFEKKTSGQVDEIVSKFIDNKNILSSTEKGELQSIYRDNINNSGYTILTEWENYLNETDGHGNYKHKTEQWKWMILNPDAADKTWIDLFTKWLNEVKIDQVSDDIWKTMIYAWRGQWEEGGRSLKTLFNNQAFATKYANKFWYTGIYTNFDSIKDLDISKIQ